MLYSPEQNLIPNLVQGFDFLAFCAVEPYLFGLNLSSKK